MNILLTLQLLLLRLLTAIKCIYKQLLDNKYSTRIFHKSKQVIRHLDRLLEKGQSVQIPFGMKFYLPVIVNGAFVDGHFVVLRAWKTPENKLNFKLIDYQLDPQNTERFSEEFPKDFDVEEFIVFTPYKSVISGCY
jgi:hypothetical protein